MKEKTHVEQHSIGQSLLLHLLPGLLITICYFVLIRPLQEWGYPSLLALMLAVVFILLPFELGYLFYQGKKKNGRFSLDGIISYREAIPGWQYILWVPILFVVLGILFTLFKPVDIFLQQKIFAGWPILESGLTGEYSKASLLVTYIIVGIFGAVVGPVVEELYFRGFLLPRMAYAGKWAPLLHSFLFALYHIFSPWMIVTRTVAMLPLIYIVQRRNIYISIATHVLVNSIDVIVGVVFIMQMV